MGNGYLRFSLGKGSYQAFKTGKPWEEIKQFQHTHDVTKEGCYECHDIPHVPPMPREAELDTGKTELSVLRDCYSHSVKKLKMEAWCPWQWYFDENDSWMSPKGADTLSQMWKDIWRTAFEEVHQSYPINELDTQAFIKRVQEILDYASVHGLWVHIIHNNGY